MLQSMRSSAKYIFWFIAITFIFAGVHPQPADDLEKVARELTVPAGRGDPDRPAGGLDAANTSCTSSRTSRITSGRWTTTAGS